MRSISRKILAIIAFAGGGSASCDEAEPLVIARCRSDVECGPGKVCELGSCQEKSVVSCQEVQGGKAILQPGPPLVEFGETGNATTFQTVALRNIGNCTLTIFDASFEDEDQTAFACPRCTPESFPIELFPFRQQELEIAFTPDGVGNFHDFLVLLSDDAEFPEIKIPLRARFNGVPLPRATPDRLDFGYVPVGRTKPDKILITNQGTGTQPLSIQRIEIVPTGTTPANAFSFEPEIMPMMPIELDPVRVDSSAAHQINVRYHPREIGGHKAELVITTNVRNAGVLRVPLEGTSKTPPKIAVSPDMITFGEVPLGQSNFQTLTISNQGGSPLLVSYRWGGVGLSTDLSALPAVVPAVMPGQFTEMQVYVTATAPRAITGLLILESNDPMRPTITIPVSADGSDVAGAQVVKIEMNYENGSDSTFDDDLRNVDMTLENPFGLICNKQMPNPTNWGSFGTPSWIAFGVKEEPERIVLPNAMQDGTYKVMLTYIEDCSSIPSGLLASILGISIDVLLAYFSGGSIAVNPAQLSDTIDDICFNHSSTAVTITVYVNGMVVAEKPVRMGRKGDYQYALDLIRQNGVYSVR